MTEPELKPLKNCSSCDGEGELINKRSSFWFIACKICNFGTALNSRDGCIERWNTRAPIKECGRCDKIEKWTQHVGCTPTILEKYKKAIEFIKNHAESSFPHCIEARKLLRELGELNE